MVYTQEAISDQLYLGDNREILGSLPDSCIDLVVTSPPYFGMRSYHEGAQIGTEETPDSYVDNLFSVMAAIKPKLKETGSMFINLGDVYANSQVGCQSPNKWERNRVGFSTKFQKTGKKKFGSIKHKSMCGVPWRFAIKMIDNGWFLRNDLIWAKRIFFESGETFGHLKPNVAVIDRFADTKEYIFYFSKNKKYYFDKFYASFPSVWMIRIAPNMAQKYEGLFGVKTASIFYSMFPENLPLMAISAAAPQDGVVCDPFLGSGTTVLVAKMLGRKYIGIDNNKLAIDLVTRRLEDV